MDLDIKKVVATYRDQQIKEFYKSKKGLFKDIEKYIAKHGGILNGVTALKNIADTAGIADSEVFSGEKRGLYVIVAKVQDYTLALAEFLAKDLGYVGIAVSSNFKGDFEILHDKEVVLTLKNTGEKTLKVLPVRTSNIGGISLKYVAPMLLKIEYLTNFIDNQEGSDKWLDNYKQDVLLEYLAPFKLSGPEPSQDRRHIDAKVLEKVRRWAVEEDRIFIGAYAYTLFMNGIKGVYYRPVITAYEIMSVNPEHDIGVLKEIFGEKNLIVKMNYSDLDYHGKKWSVSYKKVKILDIYDISNYCIPYVKKKINGDTILLGNFYVVMLYFNLGVITSFQIETVNKPVAERLRNRLNMMMMELLKRRAEFLLKSRESGIAGSGENDLFDVFQTDCIGSQKNYRREWNIKKWNGKIRRFFKEF